MQNGAMLVNITGERPICILTCHPKWGGGRLRVSAPTIESGGAVAHSAPVSYAYAIFTDRVKLQLDIA